MYPSIGSFPIKNTTLREQVGITCSAGAADIVMHEHKELG